MKWIIAALAAGALAGCGVETATTAATVATMKKQEIEQGKKTMDSMTQKIGVAVGQMQESAQKEQDAVDKQ